MEQLFLKDIDVNLLKSYSLNIKKLIDSANSEISTLLPSEWAILNRVMGSNTGVPGSFDWANAPYAREILDCGAANHPAKTIAVMKGVQIAMSTSMIQNLIGFMIDENPNNMMLLVGHTDLIKDSTERIDDVIDSAGIREKIHATSNRNRKTKSGDTDLKKEFKGGYLMIGIANHKTLRQVSIQTMIVDDFDAMKGSTKEAGSTTGMIEARQTAFRTKKKLFYISTPELKETSNIEPVYLLGDQRRYHIPCPCCNELIILEWKIQSEVDPSKNVGITWETTADGILISDSVGYTCQKCDGFFDDSGKSKWLLEEGYGGSAKWIPTAKPSNDEYYSYHISALNAPIYMNDWVYYVRDYLIANPVHGKRNEQKHQTFVNLCLGLTYEPKGESASDGTLHENIRKYEIGTIPEKLSIEDGNGKIIMITCGSDLNGTKDDARLDFEIIATSETGATYSIVHGSVGTFINKDKNPEERGHFSYEHGVHNSVWPIFEEIISGKFVNDNTGNEMLVFITGLDCGYMANYAYTFIDNTNSNVVGVKGKGFDKNIKKDADLRNYKLSSERRKLYIIETNKTKDNLSLHMGLNWNQQYNDCQPFGYMNFPTPSDGLYLRNNFFIHFEAETKIIDKNGAYRWIKTHGKQNHLFDCRLYAIVVRDIFIDQIFHSQKIKNGTWSDFVKLIMG